MANEALEYYNKLYAPLSELQHLSFDYAKAVTRMRRASTVEKRRQILLKNIKGIIKFYSKFEALHGDRTLLSDFTKYIDIFQAIIKDDFDKLLDMEDIIEQSYDKAEAYELAIDMALDKLNKSFVALQGCQIDFFMKYGIKTKTDTSDIELKIIKTNKLLEYFSSINRIVSRANRQNTYTVTAITNKDLAGLEQHIVTLVSFAEEGLCKLKHNKGYEGDSELLSTAVNMLMFYKIQGQVTYPANVELFIKTDNLQKRVKQFNKIKNKDRTQKKLTNTINI